MVLSQLQQQPPGWAITPSLRAKAWLRWEEWEVSSFPPLSVSPHPLHKRWGEDKLMNARGLLRSCSDKHEKGPADTREGGCQQQLPDLSTHPDLSELPDLSKSSPWLLKDLFSWAWFVYSRSLPIQYVIFTSQGLFLNVSTDFWKGQTHEGMHPWWCTGRHRHSCIPGNHDLKGFHRKVWHSSWVGRHT